MPILLLLTASVTQAAPPWWNSAWKFRRAVQVPSVVRPTSPQAAESKLPGSDVAVVTVPTAGMLKGGGVDIRVTTAWRTSVAHQVLMVGPGDQMSIAFALHGSVKDYFIYHGNPQAQAPEKELQIQRGVLLSTWQYPGGGTGNLAQVQRIFERAKVFIGRKFVDRIFIGHNPFGPQQRLASIFEAYLVCPRAGSYVFCSSSRNASFLSIDDQLVVSNGGFHDPQKDIRKQGAIDLKAGLHKLTFYYVSARGDPVAVAAWRPPGQSKITVIPPGAFAPVHTGQPGVLEERGKLSVDFVPVHAGESFMQNRYYQRYTFKAEGQLDNKRGAQWQWDFGDGQKATGLAAEHVYLKDGFYTVSLTARVGAAVLSRTNRIRVTRPWGRVTLNQLDGLMDYGRIASGYDFGTLPAEHLAEAMLLFHRLEQTDQILAVGAASTGRKDLCGSLGVKVFLPYADALVSTGRAKQAAVVLLTASSETDDPAAKATLIVRAGRVMLDDVNQPAKAEMLFAKAIKVGAMTRSEAVRLGWIGIGDSWRVRGDFAKASAAYKQAGDGPVRKAGGVALTRGDLARHVEDYIRRRSYAAAAETLDEWRLALPGDKLDGYWSLLQVKLLLAQERYAAAAREAEVLVGVNPQSYHAAPLLMQAYKAYSKAGRSDEAVKVLKRLVSDYSESSLAAQAVQILRGK